MKIKRFDIPIKIFVTRFFTPYPKKTVERERSTVETREGRIRAPKDIEDELIKLLADAKASNLVITVTQQSVFPPAMGRIQDHIVIRESYEVARMIMERKDFNQDKEQE